MLDRTLKSVVVKECEKGRHYWAVRPNVTENKQSKILEAQILIVPWENRSGAGESFPTGTSDFAKRIIAALESYNVEIAVEPEQYCELALHADHVRWPVMVVSTLTLGVISSVIGDEITALLNQPTPPQILETTLIVENEDGRCVSIEYEGPPSQALEALLSEVRNCIPERSQRDDTLNPSPTPDSNLEEEKKPSEPEKQIDGKPVTE